MDKRSIALARWKILRRAILSSRSNPKEATSSNYEDDRLQQVSVRSFSSFGLLHISDSDDLSKVESAECSWKRYSYNSSACLEVDYNGEANGNEVNAMIRHLPESASFDEMIGFNNTGNVCVWPSEEVLAYYCLKNREQFQGKSICELGSGMTGLAGVMLALTQYPSQVYLTDGNRASVDNMQHIIEKNMVNFGNTCVLTEVLVWNQDFLDSSHSKFDFVICADCLYFVELHPYLVQVIHKLLFPKGRALLFNPSRSGTLDLFSKAAQKLFTVKRSNNYDEVVLTKHESAITNELYKPDLHYPVMLILELS